MGRFDEDYEQQEKAAKDASEKSIFAELKDDEDRVVFAFIQGFETREEMTEWGLKMRSACNIAVFDSEGTKFDSVQILKLAPTHATKLMERRTKFGYARLYEIVRHGAARSTDTYYECDMVRDLTDDEKAHLETVPLNELWKKREDGDAPASAPTAPHEPVITPDMTEFNRLVGVEVKRLGWDKGIVKAAATRCMLIPKTGAEMTDDERSFFVAQLQGLKPGQGAEDVELYEVDLNEDTDFF